MANRLEGQIWIDKKAPYRLKYYVEGKEYSVEVSSNFKASDNIKKGCIVRYDAANEKLFNVKFPDYLGEAIGIALEDGSSSKEVIPITRTGDIHLSKEEIKKCFSSRDKSQDWKNINLVGAPVYLDLGGVIEGNASDVTTISSEDGKMTLFTPSGLKVGKTEITDYRFNIGYDNLPRIGTVSSFSLYDRTDITGAKGLNDITISINFSNFDTSLEWSYPDLHISGEPDTGYDSGSVPARDRIDDNSKPTILELYHGLFTNSRDIGFCDIISIDPDSVSKEESVVSTIVENDYTNKCTKITISTPEPIKLRVSGRVNYKYHKKD